MATVKAISSKKRLTAAIDYITKEEKVIDRYVSGVNCDADSAKQQMFITKHLYGKDTGVQYKHYVQSFHKDEKSSAEEAHEVALELVGAVRKFAGHEVLVATHQDKDHIHTHFIVNSVSFEDGRKIQTGPHFLQHLRDLSDAVCRRHGLTTTTPGLTFDGRERTETTAPKRGTYEILKRAEAGEVKSYVWDIANAVAVAAGTAASREEFIEELERQGIKTTWKDSRKNITFTDKDGNKVRNSRIQQYFNIDLTKGALERGFEEHSLERDRSEKERTGSIERIIRDSEARTESAATDRGEREAAKRRLDLERKREAEERERQAQERRSRSRARERDLDLDL